MLKIIFYPKIPVFFILLLFSAAIAGAFWTYSRIRARNLFSLRLSALLILLFIFLQPAISIIKEKKEKGSLVFLIDNSLSMSIPDERCKTRLERVCDFFDNKDFFNSLGKNNILRFYSFSDRLEEKNFEEIAGLKTNGSRTRFNETLGEIKKNFKDKSVNGIFILSDGIDNRPQSTLDSTYDFNVPIFTFAPREESGLKDIAIYIKNAPETGYLDKNIKIDFTIESINTGGKNVFVLLKEDGAGIKKEKYFIKQGENSFSMDFSPKNIGLHSYSLSIPHEIGEVTAENNEDEFFADIKKDKIYVLLLSGGPSLEYKFLHRFFSKEPDIKTVFLVAKNNNEFFKLEENEGQNVFSEKKEELFKYDLIIFNDFNIEKFSSINSLWIKEFVSEHGGGILTLGGDKDSYWQEGKFVQELTKEGKLHPIFQLSPDAKENSEIWRQLPELSGYNMVSSVKPGSQMLAVHPVSKKAVVTSQIIGRGKSLSIMVNDLWQWNFLMAGIGKTSGYYDRFLSRIVSWLTSGTNGDLNLETDKLSYSLNEKINIILSINRQDFSLKNSFEINSFISGTDKTKEILNFLPVNERMDLFKAEYQPLKSSEFEITVFVKGVGGVKKKIFVKKDRTEWKKILIDKAFLKGLSQKTHGDFVDLSKNTGQNRILNLKNQSNIVKISYQLNFWDNAVLFCLFIIFLAVEWYLRKMRGLS